MAVRRQSADVIMTKSAAPEAAEKKPARHVHPQETDLPQEKSGNGTIDADDADVGIEPMHPDPHARAPIEEIEDAMGIGDEGLAVEPIEEDFECRKPRKKRAEYIRCHPDRGLWQQAYVLVDEHDMEETTYLVAKRMRGPLQDWLSPVLLVPCVNQDGIFFVWPGFAVARQT
jgi:hypothetical protein